MSKSSTASFPANAIAIRYHSRIFDPSHKKSSGDGFDVPSVDNHSQLSIDNDSDPSSSDSPDANPHLDVEIGSSSSCVLSDTNDDSISQITKPGCTRNLKILICVVGLCLFIAGVVAAAYHWSENQDVEPFTDNVQVFTGFLRVNETFESSMSDPTSKAFAHFQDRFCSNVVLFIKPNLSETRCEINSLSPGSIVVNFRLEVLTNSSVNETQVLLTDLFNVTQVGVVPIYPDTNFSSPSQNFNRSDFTLKSSSCSADPLPIMPLEYTYPRYCSEYQVCVQGNAELKKCPEGLEFSFLSSDDATVCTQSSNLTYCAMMKANTTTGEAGEYNTTAVENSSTAKENHLSTASPSQPSSSTQVVTSATTTLPVTSEKDLSTSRVNATSSTESPATSVTSPATTTVHVTSITHTLTSAETSSATPLTTSSRPVMTSPATSPVFSTSEQFVSPSSLSSSLSSASSTTTTAAATTNKPDWPAIFKCPSTGDPYIPAADTYPNHCTKFQRCDNGAAFSFVCANGTHFVYSTSVQYVCALPTDPLTFCNRMKASLNITTSSTTSA